jgi:hypothetical protein
VPVAPPECWLPEEPQAARATVHPIATPSVPALILTQVGCPTRDLGKPAAATVRSVTRNR